MFEAPRRVAWAVAAACGVAAGVAVHLRVATVRPWLEFHVSTVSITRDAHTFELRVTPRGGETIPSVKLVRDANVVGLLGRDEFIDLLPDNAARFTLRVARDEAADPVVRIVQGGAAERTYDVTLPVDRAVAKEPR